MFEQRGLLYSAPKTVNYDPNRDYPELKEAWRLAVGFHSRDGRSGASNQNKYFKNRC
jgi:hypothetical protein